MQLIPAGALVTVPVPAPASVRFNVFAVSKSALTDCAAFMVTVHVPVPEQSAPVHPLKTQPPLGTAVSVTVGALKVKVQVAPQLMPDGLLVMRPVPGPVLVTVSAKPIGLNVAVTVRAWLIVT